MDMHTYLYLIVYLVLKVPTQILKFADDTTVLWLITNCDESEYRVQVNKLISRCSENSLELSVNQTKENIMDFGRKKSSP